MHSLWRRIIRISAMTAAGLSCLTSVATADTREGAREQAWRAAIAHTSVPSEGCFNASYPLLVWHQVSCATAPKSEFLRSHSAQPGARSVTGGDYAAVTKSRTTNAVGSFPVVKHLKSEQSAIGANDYSLQLNSNFMENDPACAGEGVAGACRGWQQFVFDNLYQNAYIQYWLVFYNATCPTGWNAGALGGCWKNSALVAVPQQAIIELPNMSVSGSAVAKGLDTLILETRTQAYSTTGRDTVLHLAADWHATDFNVLGDGSTPATFNAGASLTDRVDLTDGTTRKPTCEAYGGQSAETNNLAPGPCKVFSGAVPAMQFVETAPTP
jgi:hypothetical protein